MSHGASAGGDPHFRGLERMYLAAPINAFYEPSIEVLEGEATIGIEVEDKLHHAAGAVHGPVYGAGYGSAISRDTPRETGGYRLVVTAGRITGPREEAASGSAPTIPAR